VKAALATNAAARPVAGNILARIGGTPLVRLCKLAGATGCGDVLVKCEHLNPAGSIKDRAALAMIEAAEREGRLVPGRSVVIEATSGNTGIGLALVCAVQGYRLFLTMPDNVSPERQALLRAYGAEVHLTPVTAVMKGAMDRAAAVAARLPDAFIPQQFRNPANAETHQLTTGPEIVEQLGGRAPQAFIAGVGTGGTITGVGRALRARDPAVRLVAVEPEGSPVLQGGRPGPHPIQGIGAGFIPELLDRALLTDVRTIVTRDAQRTQALLARDEGLLVGLSSAANVKVALDVARELGPGSTVVTVLADRAESTIDAQTSSR
jgi:cysteine synthase A